METSVNRSSEVCVVLKEFGYTVSFHGIPYSLGGGTQLHVILVLELHDFSKISEIEDLIKTRHRRFGNKNVTSALVSPEFDECDQNIKDLLGHYSVTADNTNIATHDLSKLVSWADDELGKLSDDTYKPSIPKPKKGAIRWTLKADKTQLGFKVDERALVLATLLDQVHGEFCMAVLGAWGVGKTTLIENVEKLLSYSNETGDKKKYLSNYRIVWHNAWLYKKTPESWAFLYQNISEEVKKTPSLWELVSIVIGANINRYGAWSMVLAMLGIGLCLIPTTMYLKIAISMPLILTLSLVSVGYLVYRTLPRATYLLQQFGKIATYQSTLGLQGLIGRDLEALIESWIPNEKESSENDEQYAHSPAIRIQHCVCIISFSFVWFIFWISSLMSDSAQTETLVWSSSTISSCTLWILWTSAAVLVLLAATNSKRSANKLLLVVDDIDRCDPDVIIEVLESLKLLLETKKIAARLQILILMEEKILNHAIYRKYYLNGNIQTQDLIGAKSIVNEHRSKLFACEWRIPQPELQDSANILRNWAGISYADYADNVTKNVDDMTAYQQVDHFPDFDATLPTLGDRAENYRDSVHQYADQTRLRIHETVSAKVDFDTNEVDDMVTYLPKYLERTGQLPTPRNLRRYLIQLKLARLIATRTSSGIEIITAESISIDLEDILKAFSDKDDFIFSDRRTEYLRSIAWEILGD